MAKEKAILTALFTLLFVGFISAAPNIKVLYPNGGEILSGIRDLQFNVSNAWNQPSLNAWLYYSASPGTRTNFIGDFNLLDGNYCTPKYEQEEMWKYLDGVSPANLPEAGFFFITDWADGSFDGNLMYFGRYQTGSYGSSCFWTNKSGYINTENGDIVETNILNGMFENVKPGSGVITSSCWHNIVTGGGNSYTYDYGDLHAFYKPDSDKPSVGETYVYKHSSGFYSQTSDTSFLEFDWNGTLFSPTDTNKLFEWFSLHGTWTYTYSYCNGRSTYSYSGKVCQDGNCVRPTFRKPFNYNGNYWLVGRWNYSPNHFYVCSGETNPTIKNWYGFRNLGDGNWTRDDSLVANTDINALTFFWQYDNKCTMKIINETLYCIGLDEFNNPAAIAYDGENWARIADYNKGIISDIYNLTSAPLLHAAYNGKEILLKSAGENSQIWKNKELQWETQEKRTCSLPWETSTAQQGIWYLDVNISNRLQSGQDSSDTNFLIQNTCSNGIKNGNETDTDCGGSCQKCEERKNCLRNEDCQSNYCDTSNKCSIQRDLYIEWIKPIQVVEDVPLVAGKATVVRVKVVNNGPETTTDVSINYANGCYTETKQNILIKAFSYEIVDFYPPNNCTK